MFHFDIVDQLDELVPLRRDVGIAFVLLHGTEPSNASDAPMVAWRMGSGGIFILFYYFI